MSNTNLGKEAVGKAAANLIKDGMTIGLGTGSTAEQFIKHLIMRCQQGLQIKAVATSEKSFQQALIGHIPMVDINTLTSLDLAIDGADEIDPQNRMIKGGGGALLREKIIANMSKEMVVIVDQSKLVEKLGAFPLPVEIVPFGHLATRAQLESLGYYGNMRLLPDDKPYITDNGNFIIDLDIPDLKPEQDHHRLLVIPGVVETGLFLGLAGRVLIGYDDGHVEVRA